MIKELMQDARDRMHASIQSLEDALSTIRTGRASPVLVEKLMIKELKRYHLKYLIKYKQICNIQDK